MPILSDYMTGYNNGWADGVKDYKKKVSANPAPSAERQEKANELHKRCATFPFFGDRDGFMALLDLRNHVEALLQANGATTDVPLSFVDEEIHMAMYETSKHEQGYPSWVWAKRFARELCRLATRDAAPTDAQDAARWRELKQHTLDTEKRRGCTASEYGQPNWLLNYATMDDFMDEGIKSRIRAASAQRDKMTTNLKE
jgi:hypothetical protein